MHAGHNIPTVIGTRHDGGVIPAALAEDLLTQQAPNFPIGLGLKLDAGSGAPFHGAGTQHSFGHGGDDQGFVAAMFVYADSGDGAVVMTNSDDGDAVILALLEALARAYGWAEPRWQNDDLADPDADALGGAYRFEDGTCAELTARNGELHLTLGRQPPIRFARARPGRWDAGAVKASILVAEDSTGGETSFVLHQEAMYVRDAVARRV